LNQERGNNSIQMTALHAAPDSLRTSVQPKELPGARDPHACKTRHKPKGGKGKNATKRAG